MPGPGSPMCLFFARLWEMQQMSLLLTSLALVQGTGVPSSEVSHDVVIENYSAMLAKDVIPEAFLVSFALQRFTAPSPAA